jgi:type II secretory pathway component GspD/PulD (secretin)
MQLKEMPMPKTRLPLLIACALLLAAVTVCVADDVTQSQDFSLSSVKPKDALTVLRTIVGTKAVNIVEPRTVILRDTPDNLALAETLIKIMDSSGEGYQHSFHKTSDGSVVLSVILEQASAKDVLTVLRTQLRIRRIATLGDTRIILRDTEDQADAALDLIQKVDQASE